MRPRGYSNSARQPLFCISGPTQLPSGTQIIYIAFSILSLPPFSVSLSVYLFLASTCSSSPSPFSSFARRVFFFFPLLFLSLSFSTSRVGPQQSRIDSIQIHRHSRGLPGSELNNRGTVSPRIRVTVAVSIYCYTFVKTSTKRKHNILRCRVAMSENESRSALFYARHSLRPRVLS